jgi:hypothetical protein
MAIHKLKLTKTLVRQLYELACTPFRLASFRERWDSFGWSYKPGVGDEFGFQVHVRGSWPLTIDPLGEEVICADFPFYYWEDYDPQFHKDLEEYNRRRQAYEDEFETALNLARGVLATPLQFWTDADKDAHKAVVWEGDHGLLILQQAAFDLQFGIQLDFWLMGCSRQDFHPTTPLIDWLCKRSKRLHAKSDFPPLCW